MQDLILIAIGVGATGFLLYTIWKTLYKSGGCHCEGSSVCSGCGSKGSHCFSSMKK